MKIKYLLVAWMAGLSFLTSCNKEEKPQPAGIGFEVDYQEVEESDGTFESFHPALTQGQTTGREIEIKLTLNKALAETAVIAFTIEGTATVNSAAKPVGDFEIGERNVIIEKGSTGASISIQLFEDATYEFEEYNDNGLPYENIKLTLTSVVSGPATIVEEKKSFQLDILEDDALVFLVWDPQDDQGVGAGNVEMDLFLWLDNEIFDSSIDGVDQELVIIFGGYPDGTYGFSYTYYEGTSDNLRFNSVMFGNINNQQYPYPESPLVSSGTYKLVNKNVYDRSASTPPDVAIVQSVVKTGTKFTNLSSITVPASGSRQGGKTSIYPPRELVKRLKINSKKGEIAGELNKTSLKK